MSLIKRKIDVEIKLNGDTFNGHDNTIRLTGLRCSVTVQSFIGAIGNWASSANIRISGMKNADMAQLSTLGFSAANYNDVGSDDAGSGPFTLNQINIYAGDDESGMSLIFGGAIVQGEVDYNAMPDVGVDLVCNALTSLQMDPIAASSYRGAADVASMLEGICRTAKHPMTFINNGVDTKLNNHAVGGSGKNQIEDICLAAGCLFTITGPADKKTLTIFPKGGNTDNTIIAMGPSTGLVGYPIYSMRGVNITSIFTPTIQVGRRIKLTSSTPAPAKNAPRQEPGFAAGKGPLQISGANGTFPIIAVTHNLASETPNGPWFTQAELTSLAYNAH